MATQNPYSNSLLMDAFRGSLSNAESLGRGFAVAPIGLLGDINALARQYVTPSLPQGVQSLLQSAPAAPTTEQILSNIPRVSNPRMETAGMEQLGAAMNPRGPVDLAKGVGRVAGNAINEAMVYDRGLLAGVTPQPNRIFVPASKDEAMKASRMLKTMSPQDVWRDAGVGKFAGEYVKEISDQGAKFNTAQDIASDAQKIRDRNVELKQTIKESQSTYPDLFPKELTAARRPLREEIKTNQNMLDRNYGYESDPKWAGNFAQLAYDHPELYKEFPELKNVVVRQGRDEPNFLGSYQRLPHLDVGSIDVTKSGLLNNPRSTATHEMQHAVSDLSGWQAGGAPEMFRQQEAAQMTKDALSWNKEIENAKNRYPNEDRAFLESVVVNDYAKAGAPDWVPSIEARDMARLFSKYPEQLDEAKKLVKVYGLDRKTTPNSPDKVYKNLEGEALARLAQTRIDLTPEERLQYFPFEQQTPVNKYGMDVNPEDLIYRDTVESLLGR
jgi:hypothetical protein